MKREFYPVFPAKTGNAVASVTRHPTGLTAAMLHCIIPETGGYHRDMMHPCCASEEARTGRGESPTERFGDGLGVGGWPVHGRCRRQIRHAQPGRCLLWP